MLLVGASDAYTKRMEYFRLANPHNDPLLIYSMWKGYLNEEEAAYNPKLRELYDKWPRHCDDLHTSGHVYKEDIEEMIRKVRPGEAIIPIHTEKKGMFNKLDITELRGIVCPMSDGDCYVVGGKGK